MEIAYSEKRDKLIAAGISLLVMGLVLLGLYLLTITTPIPPFPESEVHPELGYVDLGTDVEGLGNVDHVGMGDNGPGSNDNSAATSAQTSNENYVTDDSEPTAPVNVNPNPNNNNNTTNTTEQQIDDELQSLLNNYKNNKGTGGNEGDGNKQQVGDKGSPHGVPDGGDTDGKTRFYLKGRKMLKMPDAVHDSQDQGKVVVEIVVDAKGNVIKAEPGAKGSMAYNHVLYAKARQAALTAKFDPSPEGISEQRGTITFVFVLQ